MIKLRQQRLKEVYDHLRKHHGIHTQIDFANAIGITRPAISSAMNGNEAYLTDNLFKRICAKYQGVFNLDYLLYGKGELLSDNEKYEINRDEYDEVSRAINEQIDQSSLVNAALAAKDETIASQRETIMALKRENEMLRQHLSKYKEEEVLGKFPFTPGVAEKDDRNPAHV